MGVKQSYTKLLGGLGTTALLAGAAATAVGTSGGMVGATAINIQFGDTSTNNVAYTGVGMDTQDTGTAWNFVTTAWATNSNLVDSTGAVTSVGAYAQGNTGGDLGATVTPAYMSGAFWNSNQYASWAGALQMAVTVSGLSASSSYQLYVYSDTPSWAGGTTAIQLASANTPAGGAANLLLYSNGATTPSAATEVTPTAAAATVAPASANGNWGVLNAVAGSNGRIVLNYYVPSYLISTTAGANDREFLNAIQIQPVSTVIPEPATLGLFALGGLGLLLVGRKRLKGMAGAA